MMRRVLLIAALCALAQGCAHRTLKHRQWSEEVHGYRCNTFRDTSNWVAKTQWFVLRDPATLDKAVDSVAAAGLAARVDSPDGGLKPEDVRVLPQAQFFGQYTAARQYFAGVERLRQRRFTEALARFGAAGTKDHDLEFFSDLDYMKAVCRAGMGDSAAADSCYERFRRRSEAVAPGSFFVRTAPKNRLSLGQVISPAEDSGAVYPGHFTEHIQGPALRHPAYHGFLRAVEKPSFDIMLGTVYSEQDKLQLLYEVGLTYPFGLRAYTNTWTRQWGMGLEYQLYRRWDNRLGLLTALRYHKYTQELDNGARVPFPQYQLDLEGGFYLLPRLCLYAGGRYYYWNESHFYKGPYYHLWCDNDAYAGAGFFVWEYVALVGQYSRENKLEVGINVMGMEALFKTGPQ